MFLLNMAASLLNCSPVVLLFIQNRLMNYVVTYKITENFCCFYFQPQMSIQMCVTTMCKQKILNIASYIMTVDRL